MKQQTSFKSLLYIAAFSTLFSGFAFAKSPTRVVIVALDGISVEGLAKAHTPNLDALLRQGAFSTHSRVVMPSVTLPNWTAQFTGSGPEINGVIDNDWQIDKKNILPAVETDAKGYFPSVFKILKDNNPNIKIAYYYNWLNLIYPYNQDYFDEVNYLKNDSYTENYDKALNFIISNKNKPTLVFLYSVHTDHAGHKFGWMSPEYIQAIEAADVQIGEFITKLKNQKLYDNTNFMFLSDHGGINKGHGGFSVTEMEVPWGITGPTIKKDFKIVEPNNTINTAAVILHLFKCKKPLVWTSEVPKSIFR